LVYHSFLDVVLQEHLALQVQHAKMASAKQLVLQRLVQAAHPVVLLSPITVSYCNTPVDTVIDLCLRNLPHLGHM